MPVLAVGVAAALSGALEYGWKRLFSIPLFACGPGVLFPSTSFEGFDRGTCEAGGVLVVLALMVANPDAGGGGGALIEANPDDIVVGGGRVSYTCLGGVGFTAGVTGD